MTSPAPVAPVPSHVALLTVKYAYQGQEMANVLAFTNAEGTAGGSAASQQLADQATAAWWNNIKTRLSTSLTLTGATLRGQDFGVPSVFEAVLPTGLAGAFAGAPSSPVFSAVMLLKSTRGGRSGMGRIYVPGLLQADMNANGQVWTPAPLEALRATVATFQAGTYAGQRLCVYSRRHGTAALVTGVSARQKVGVQRKRLYA